MTGIAGRRHEREHERERDAGVMTDQRVEAGPVAVLIGPPGAGKSTVGTLLAERLGVAFRDTDADIEASEGTSIADLFVERGEPYFRERERAAVATALAEHPGVLAVGGGAVMDEDTRASLTGRPVVFLDVGVHDAAQRVGLNRDRPLLLGNVRARWTTMMKERRPVYESVAAHTVLTDGRAPAEIAGEIEDLLRSRGGAR
jgi:shikimate kinase